MYSLETQAVAVPQPAPFATGQNWFAIQTRPRHEKRVVAELQLRGINTFLPVLTEVHKWSDRRKSVQVPLFSCYAFVSVESGSNERLTVLRTPGVLGFVGCNHCPAPITHAEIENIRVVLASTATFSTWPFLKVGQRVRVREGALSGLEGILIARNGERGLVVSIDAIARSLLVRIEGYEVEPVTSTTRGCR